MSKWTRRLLLFCLMQTLASGTVLAEPTQPEAPKCDVSLDKPMQDSSSDAQSVIEVLTAITKALAAHDFKAMAAHLDQNCTTYDETTHKLVAGRDAIVKDVEAKVIEEEQRLKSPPLNFTVEKPYVRITGNQAVVTFVLVKEIGGATPAKYESHCSDVFVKRNGEWKKLHYCGDAWKQVK